MSLYFPFISYCCAFYMYIYVSSRVYNICVPLSFLDILTHADRYICLYLEREKEREGGIAV